MLATPAVESSSLSDIPLFAGLSEEHRNRLSGYLNRRVVPAGRDIMHSEQPGEAVYVLLSGTLKIHTEHKDGRDVVLALLGPGQTVGEMSIVDSAGRSATVSTLEESVLLCMGRSTFLDCLQTMPVLSMNLMRILSSRLRLANATIQSLVALDASGRVARQLLALAEEYGRPAAGGAVYIPLSLTQSDLADIVGVSRVRVNQVLMDYRQRGYISMDSRHHVTIHDRDSLVQRAE